MSEAIVVSDAVRVPRRAMTIHAVRASGPGGQNVNKVATRVELRVDLNAVEGLSGAALARLLDLARHRIAADGRLVVTSQATRRQALNVDDARAKVAGLLRAALAPPHRRVRPAPPAGASRRRLAQKKRRAAVKRWRGRPAEEDDGAARSVVRRLRGSTWVMKQQVYEVPFQTLAEAGRAANQDLLVSNPATIFARALGPSSRHRGPQFRGD